jgi:hypothetical protein
MLNDTSSTLEARERDSVWDASAHALTPPAEETRAPVLPDSARFRACLWLGIAADIRSRAS